MKLRKKPVIIDGEQFVIYEKERKTHPSFLRGWVVHQDQSKISPKVFNDLIEKNQEIAEQIEDAINE